MTSPLESFERVEFALLAEFPGIPFHVSVGRTAVVAKWDDGPTAQQVENHLIEAGLDLTQIRIYRHISDGFRALLADDIELGADPGHEDEDLESRISRLARTTSVDGERCVWSVPA